MIAYLRMLVMNRLSALQPGTYTKPGKSKVVGALKIIGFVLLLLIAYASIAFLEYMVFSLVDSMGQGQTVIGLALLGCTLITLIYGFFHVNGVLFFGRDTAFLGSLPLRSTSVLAGKMVKVAAGEAGISLLFVAPLVVSYGISVGAGVLYYVKCLVTFILIPLIPLSLCMLLSFVLIRISALWKRREGMTTIIALLFFVGILAAEFSMQSMEEEEITKWLLALLVGQSSLTQLLLRNLPWLQWANDGILTSGAAAWGKLGLYALLSLGVMALVIYLLGGGYMKLAIRQSEAIGAVNRSKKRARGSDDVRKPVVALMWQEVRDVITVPIYATNCLLGLIMIPIMLVLPVLSEPDFLGEVSNMLRTIPASAVLVFATALFGLVGTMCEAASTAVSREGRTHELRKTYPLSAGLQLRSKVYMGVVFHGAGILLTAIIGCVVLPTFWPQILLAAVCSLAIAFLLSAIGVAADVIHPKLNWKTETEAVKQNFIAVLAMLLNIVALGLMVLVFVLCVNAGMSWTIAFVLAMALVLVMDGLLLWWLNTAGGKLYLKH